MAKTKIDETATDTTTPADPAPASPEVLLPVVGLPVTFIGGDGQTYPGEIDAVFSQSIDVKATKPSGTVFVQRLPITPGEKSPKGYSWRHC